MFNDVFISLATKLNTVWQSYGMSVDHVFIIGFLCAIAGALIAYYSKLHNFNKEHPLPWLKSFRIKLGLTTGLVIGGYLVLNAFVLLLIVLFEQQILRGTAQSQQINAYFNYIWLYILGSILGVIVSIVAFAVIIKAFFGRVIDQKIISNLNKISTDFQRKTSDINEYLPDGVNRQHFGDYNPVKHFKNGMLFHGLNLNPKEHKKPIYTDFDKSLNGHIGVIGGTGAGKGVLTRIYLAQFIQNGLTNVIFDPKPDNYLFDLCAEWCKKHNKRLTVIDLDDHRPQLNLFKGLSARAIELIIKSAMELSAQQQTNARIYASQSKRANFEALEAVYQDGMTPNELEKAILQYDAELLSDTADSYRDIMTALTRFDLFNTHESPTLLELLNDDGVVFIRCAEAKGDDDKQAIAKIIFEAITHLIVKNPNKRRTLFVDEFKFVMTTQFMNNLATIREAKTTLLVNFQSLSNFMTSTNHAMRNIHYAKELVDNLQIFAVGNTADPETIKIIQQKTGKATFKKRMENEESLKGGGTKTDVKRRFIDVQEYKLTENEIAQGDSCTMILITPLLQNGFERIATHYIETPRGATFEPKTYPLAIQRQPRKAIKQQENTQKKGVEQAQTGEKTHETRGNHGENINSVNTQNAINLDDDPNLWN